MINEILHRNTNNNLSCEFEINNESVSDPVVIAQSFNDYYVNVGANLAESINNNTNNDDNNLSFVDFMGDRLESELIFQSVSVDDIISIVKDMKNSSAGSDDVPASMVKQVINYIAEPLCHICNCSLLGGVFPSGMKIAKVLPIYKKENKRNLKNYRPISLLPCFSKIIEKVINIQLMQYLELNDIFDNKQFGFRPNRSTTAATLCLTDFILDAFDKKEFVIGAFLDLTKAFETVDHPILLQKLHHIGIRNTSLDLFKSYLFNRQQYVEYKNSNSDLKTIKYSVPQGSILGPVLFLIYINDISHSSHILKNVLFADDTCLYASHSDLYSLIDSFNRELVTVNSWLKANKLSLNITKSTYIIFSRRKKVPPDIPNIIIDNVILKRSMDVNFLGINITHNLSWNLHIKYLTSKMNKMRGILYVVRQFLNLKSKKLIYYALIYSNLLYGNVIWGKAPKSTIKSLIIGQKKIIRAIMGVDSGYHTHDLFVELKILKINEINIFNTSVFVFKSLNGLTIPLDYFNNNNNNNFNLRNANTLRPPFVPSNQSQSSPRYYGCIIWNSLPQDILSISNINTFKKKLREHLLSLYDA